MAEMSTSGGEPIKIQLASLSFNSLLPLSLSQDGSELLVMDGHGLPLSGPLWSVPMIGGSPRKLGDVAGQDGAWSVDGKFIAYSDHNALFTAKADGTDARKVITVGDSGFVFNPVWSPDGTHLRFIYAATLTAPDYFMEVSLDGTGLHRLLPESTNPPDPDADNGRWTVDGKYFVFMTGGQIWALPRNAGFLHSEPKPSQLTFSPMPFSPPVQSTDGKKLFVVGRTFRGELTRYDLKSGRFESYLGGISAEGVSFSKDGQWVAYVSFPEGTLWRSKMDGSERLQLTYAPSQALMPRWSPDGKTILFYDPGTNKPSKIYEVPLEGGSPRPLMPDNPDPQTDANWSPDGSKIVFAGRTADPASSIRIFDLATRQVSTLPGSQGMYSPRWSPEGRYIPALSVDSKRLLLFDFQTQRWTELAQGSMGWLEWSKDGQYLQAYDASGTGALIRIRMSDHKTERVVDLKNFQTVGFYGQWFAVAPDDSPIMLRNIGTQDVYALDWEEP
jgi:Tol biopolymer transport system component